MKQVVIFTYNRSYNFGANLQGFALRNFIRSLGYGCKTIDTRNPADLRNEPIKYPGIRGIVHGFFDLPHNKERILGKKRFNEFDFSPDDRTENFYGPEQEVDFQKLESHLPPADVYLTGSDQVFSPAAMYRLFFLDFDTKGIKRISYAASVGMSEIPEDKKMQIRTNLSRFAAISVREESAKTALQPLVDIPISVNIDPVLLLSRHRWEQEAAVYKPLEGKEYILAYFIYRPKNLNSMLRKLHKETGLPIVLIDNTAFRNIYNNKLVLDAGPREFLWLAAHAESIITTSFHATAFSLMFDKNFVSISPPKSGTRIDNLLSVTGCQKHKIGIDCVMPDGCMTMTDKEKNDKNTAVLHEITEAEKYLRKNIG